MWANLTALPQKVFKFAKQVFSFPLVDLVVYELESFF